MSGLIRDRGAVHHIHDLDEENIFIFVGLHLVEDEVRRFDEEAGGETEVWAASPRSGHCRQLSNAAFYAVEDASRGGLVALSDERVDRQRLSRDRRDQRISAGTFRARLRCSE